MQRASEREGHFLVTKSIHKLNNQKKVEKITIEQKKIPYRSCSNDLIIFLQNKHIKTTKINPC